MTRMTVENLHQQTERAVEMAEAGVKVEVTREGRVVAELVPVATKQRSPVTPEREAARQRIMAFFRKGMDLGGEKLTMEDRYGDARL